MFAPNTQNNNNLTTTKWQDKFVFHYGCDKQADGIVQNSVLLSPTTPTKCCIPSPFQDDVFFGANKTATYIPPSLATSTTGAVTATTPHSDFFILDTPKSAFCPASVSTAVPQGDLVFKFEPEHIELMNKCDQYMDGNFNDDNCHSKHYSPCNTPPSATHPVDEYNNFDFAHYQTPLPPINTIQPSVQYHPSNQSNYEEHFIDTSFLAQYPSPVTRVHQTDFQNDSYSQPANFNVTGDDKPNREFKQIDFDGVVASTDANKSDGIHEEQIGLEGESSEPVTCLWADCYKEFASQSDLVAHIEKLHIEGRKGEEFSCFWQGCSRAKKPFNARYKLLIHMRVHSGEKPNKCPVS